MRPLHKNILLAVTIMGGLLTAQWKAPLARAGDGCPAGSYTCTTFLNLCTLYAGGACPYCVGQNGGSSGKCQQQPGG
jgi:hypothetical protein